MGKADFDILSMKDLETGEASFKESSMTADESKLEDSWK